MLRVRESIEDYLGSLGRVLRNAEKAEIRMNGKLLGEVPLTPPERFSSDTAQIAKRAGCRLAEMEFFLKRGDRRVPVPPPFFCADLVHASFLVAGGLNLFIDPDSVKILSESGFTVYPPAILRDLQKTGSPLVRGVVAVIESPDRGPILKLLIYQFSALPPEYLSRGKVLSLVCKDVIEGGAFIVDFGPYSYGRGEFEEEVKGADERLIENTALCFMAMTAEIEGKATFGISRREIATDLPGKSFFIRALRKGP